MTKMIIDNKATAEKKYECYDIDRNEYPTVDEMKQSYSQSGMRSKK
jgi:hypothetical protein